MPVGGKAGRGRVLCVLPSAPLPANTGGRIRTWTLVRALDQAFELTVAVPCASRTAMAELGAALDGRIVSLSPGNVIANAEANLLSALRGEPLYYGRYSTNIRKRELEAVTSSSAFDIVHFDHLHMAQLLSAAGSGACRVLDAHNLESLLLWRYADTQGAALRRVARWQAQRVERLEARLAREVDVVLACSSDDAAGFAGLGARRVEVIPNPVPTGPCAAPAALRTDLILVGSFDWPPNEDAARELEGRIWPACRHRLPATRLVFVGRGPPRWLRSRQGPALVVTGAVPEVGPHLARAWATAIPLRAGSGTRIKILEAWAAGVPVVATRLAAEGLLYRAGDNVLLADGPEEFAQALVLLKDNDVLSQRLRQGGRAAAAQFSAEIVGDRHQGGNPPGGRHHRRKAQGHRLDDRLWQRIELRRVRVDINDAPDIADIARIGADADALLDPESPGLLFQIIGVGRATPPEAHQQEGDVPLLGEHELGRLEQDILPLGGQESRDLADDGARADRPEGQALSAAPGARAWPAAARRRWG